MKALVIGGNGFIGSHLVDRLLAAGWEVVILDVCERRFGEMPERVQFIRGDFNQSYIVREALTGVEVVFHLAWATIHEVSNRDPAADVLANLIPSIHLLEACRLNGVRRIVFTSSGGTVYGPARKIPICESHPQNPVTGYGITKLAVEKYLEMFHHLYGLEYAVLRPSVPYGPRQNPLGRQGAVAVFLYRVGNGLPITLWGDGSITRDFFYVTDLAEATQVVATHKLNHHRVFNIGGGGEIRLIDLVKAVERATGKNAMVEYRPERQFDAPRIALDTSLAQRVLGWAPRVSLERGLNQTWQWIDSAFAAIQSKEAVIRG